MDVLKAMRIFMRVVEAGSLTAAAESFGLSATMIGNHLQALEAHLGTRLLHRTTRRQALTPFGKAYYARCQEIVALVEDAETLAQVEQSAVRGTLRVTAPIVWSRAALVPALGEFLGRCPEVELDLMATDALLDFVDSGIDAAIRLGAGQGAGQGGQMGGELLRLPLRPYALVLCAAPGYLAARGRPAAPADLAGHDCLAFGYPPTSEYWQPVPSWRLGARGGEGPPIDVPITPRVRIGNSFALHGAALEGLGIALLPEILVAADLAAGRLCRLLPDHPPPALPLNLLLRRDRRRPPRLEQFVTFIRETFA